MEWEQRLANLWASFDDRSESDFLSRMDALVAELPADSAVGLFERAGSLDSTGHSDRAVPLYRRAHSSSGCPGSARRMAVIQLASSLRNIGYASESVALLTAERERESDDLDDAVSATLALALVDVGREREAVSVAVGCLVAPHDAISALDVELRTPALRPHVMSVRAPNVQWTTRNLATSASRVSQERRPRGRCRARADPRPPVPARRPSAPA